MADPLTLKEIKRRLEGLNDYELQALWNWLNPMSIAAPAIMPRIYSIKGLVNEEIMRRQVVQQAPEEGYSDTIREMYGLR